MTTPLEKHNKLYKKRLAKQKERHKILLQNSGVVNLPPEVIEHLSVAYRDSQTSLNNLDSALGIVRSLSSSSPGEDKENLDYQQSQDQQKSQESNRPSFPSQQDQKTNQSLPLSLQSLSRKLRNLEFRQISLVRKYRKCFAYLGFRQSFVDQLEGVVSIYGDDSDPAIAPDKGLGIYNASTE